MMTLQRLQELLNTGEFHHATYRDLGTIWEGLYIYVKQDNGFNGFVLEGCYGRDNPDISQAEEMVRHTGVSVGAYGKG
jgi:hypothetical protein